MLGIYIAGPFRGWYFNPDHSTINVEWYQLTNLLRAHCMAFIAQTHKKSAIYANQGITVYVDINGNELDTATMLEMWEQSWDWEYPIDEDDAPRVLRSFSHADLQVLAPVSDYQKDIDLTDILAELNDPEWQDFNDDNRDTTNFGLEDYDEDEVEPKADAGKPVVHLRPVPPATHKTKPNLAQMVIDIGRRIRGLKDGDNG